MRISIPRKPSMALPGDKFSTLESLFDRLFVAKHPHKVYSLGWFHTVNHPAEDVVPYAITEWDIIQIKRVIEWCRRKLGNSS